jgi:hypothetical protein
MKKFFFMYIFLFIIPICCSLFTEKEWLEKLLMQIAIPPALILFLIEMIQMSQQGIEYFMGWNLVDFSLFSIFLGFEYLKQMGIEHSALAAP